MNYPEDKCKGIEIQKLKALELEKSINELESRKSSIECEIKEFKGVFRRIEEIMFDLDKLGEIREDKKAEQEGKMLIDKKDFEELLDISKRQHILENRLRRIEKENDRLKGELNEAVKTIREKDEELECKSKLKKELYTATAMLKKTDYQFRMLSDFLKSIDQFGNAREFMLQREKEKSKVKK